MPPVDYAMQNATPCSACVIDGVTPYARLLIYVIACLFALICLFIRCHFWCFHAPAQTFFTQPLCCCYFAILLLFARYALLHGACSLRCYVVCHAATCFITWLCFARFVCIFDCRLTLPCCYTPRAMLFFLPRSRVCFACLRATMLITCSCFVSLPYAWFDIRYYLCSLYAAARRHAERLPYYSFAYTFRLFYGVCPRAAIRHLPCPCWCFTCLRLMPPLFHTLRCCYAIEAPHSFARCYAWCSLLWALILWWCAILARCHTPAYAADAHYFSALCFAFWRASPLRRMISRRATHVYARTRTMLMRDAVYAIYSYATPYAAARYVCWYSPPWCVLPVTRGVHALLMLRRRPRRYADVLCPCWYMLDYCCCLARHAWYAFIFSRTAFFSRLCLSFDSATMFRYDGAHALCRVKILCLYVWHVDYFAIVADVLMLPDKIRLSLYTMMLRTWCCYSLLIISESLLMRRFTPAACRLRRRMLVDARL